jgi:hypothetical protein
MAITIIQEPSSFAPVYNGLVYTASSTNTGEDNFQFVFDVYINGSFATRHRVSTDPTNGHAKFDAGIIAESYVSHNILSTTTGFATNPNSYCEIQVKVGEEYDVVGVKTLFADLDTSTEIYTFNSVFDFLDFVGYSSSDYLLTSSTKKFLSNAPSTQYVRSGNRLWLYSINNVPSDYTHLQIKTYNSSGVLVDTVNYANTFTASTDVNRFLRVGVGPWNILQVQGSTFLDNISYYTVQAMDTGVAISEIKRFNIDEACTKYEVIRLQFLNKLGGFDAMNFTKLSRSSSSIERTSYKKGAGTFASDGTFAYSKGDRMNNTMSVISRDKLIINSDWINEEESTWLKELVTSPLIFQETAAGDLIPVSVTDSLYESKKIVNDKLFNLKLELEYAYVNSRQRY